MHKRINYKLVLHLAVTALFIAAAFYVTIKTKPYPFSDFLYYWNYVTDFSIYTKGGLLFVLYAPLKLAGLTPYISAFIVNSLCFIALSYAMWLGKKQTKWQWVSSILLGVIGIWFLAFMPIVNTDIPTIALFLLGIRLFIDFLDTKKKLYLGLAIASTAISLSMRSQFFYISIFLIVIILAIFLFQYLKKIPFNSSLKFFLILILASTVISFAATKSLGTFTKDKSLLAVYNRVTFYTGLLDTPSVGASCGTYNDAAVEKALAELNQPFVKTLITDLKAIPVQQLVNTVLCKWNNYIFQYNQFGTTWLWGHITNGWTETKTVGFFWQVWEYMEYFAAKILKLAGFALVLLFIYDFKKFKKSEITVFLFAMFTVLMFFGIHTILEIQPRYIISPVIIAIVIPLYLHAGLFKKNT